MILVILIKNTLTNSGSRSDAPTNKVADVLPREIHEEVQAHQHSGVIYMCDLTMKIINSF